MTIDGQFTLLISEDGAKIEFRDPVAATTFLRAEIAQEDFMKALGRLSNVPCQLTISGINRVGTKHECRPFEFEIPAGRKKDDAFAVALELCPNGWQPDNYFGSKDSFFLKDGIQFAKCTIRRWI